jgi:hypothetical protein
VHGFLDIHIYYHYYSYLVLFLGGNVTDLRPTQPPIQWVPGALSQRVNWPEHEADPSPLSHEVLSLHGATSRDADKSLALPIFLFAAQPKEFFLDGLKELEQRSHKCAELRGNM